ncbi:MAG: hypothetical protein LBQ31_01680 [Bacteroidales bacterium]|jgi:hypothetical protein|nr:hypothetical protein [Bacteroidales bacterium]
MRRSLLLILVSLFAFYGCVVEPSCFEDAAQSEVWYARNTLDYAVMVQCFYTPLDTTSDTLWCEREPVAWSEPININPNERKMIMDYVQPVYIKVYRSVDTSLLLETRDLRTWLMDKASNGAILHSTSDDSELGELGSNLPSKSPCIYEEAYYMENSRYLLENVPWDVYPIWFDKYGCAERDESYWEGRKTDYEYTANGYAIVQCITFDKNKAPFN